MFDSLRSTQSTIKKLHNERETITQFANPSYKSVLEQRKYDERSGEMCSAKELHPAAKRRTRPSPVGLRRVKEKPDDVTGLFF